MLRKLAAAIALSSGMLGNGVAYGLGLGNASLDSSLNQKLDVEIELIEADGLTAAEILPSLATAADFKRADLQRPASLSKLNFEVATGADNKPYIRVTSREPVVEPYLNFLLEVHWPDGRLLREYTLLLDLPSFSSDIVASQQAPVKPATSGKPAISQKPATLGSDTPPYSSAEFTSRSPSDTYRVRKSDTLSQIAMQTRPQGVSLNRMMAALQAENPTAFINGNINLLKQGVTLNIPDRSMLVSIDEARARNTIFPQNQEWRKGQGKVQIDATPRESAAEPVRKTEKGRLDIVVGGGFGEGQGASRGDRSIAQELESTLAVNQEELDTLGRENTELKERLRDLKDQIGTLEKLVVLRNDQLAAAQTLADQPVEKQVKEVLDVLPSGQTSKNQPSEEVDYNFQSGLAGNTERNAPRPPPVDDVFRPPVDDGIGLVPIIGGSAVALLTLLGGLLFLRRRQEQEIDDIYEEEDDPNGDSPEGEALAAKSGYPSFGSDLQTGAMPSESIPSGAMPSSAGAPPQPSPGFDYDYDDDLDNFMDDFDDQSSGGSSKSNTGSDHGGFEFDLNHGYSSTSPSGQSGSDVDMDLDLSALEAELEGEMPTRTASRPAAQDDELAGFDDFDDDSHSNAAKKQSVEEESWDDDLSLDDLDAELMNLSNAAGSDNRASPKGSGDSDQSGTDEVGTMLDLARAYVDMGDEEGARDILEEIATDGSAAQRAEAQQLLNKLG